MARRRRSAKTHGHAADVRTHGPGSGYEGEEDWAVADALRPRHAGTTHGYVVLVTTIAVVLLLSWFAGPIVLELVGGQPRGATDTAMPAAELEPPGKFRPSLGNARVAVRQSGVQGAGLGAFARRTFEAGAMVGPYRCKIFPTIKNSLAPGSGYDWRFNATHNCDGEQVRRRNPLRYVNSVAALESCSQQNTQARFSSADGEPPVVYIATRRIEMGEELFVDYGEDYFRNHLDFFRTEIFSKYRKTRDLKNA